MNELYVGNSIVGNFKTLSEIKNLKEFRLEKYDGALHLLKGKESIELKPLDDNANLVINNFSTEVGELNESIYKLEVNNDVVIVILYVYTEVQKLLLKSQKICIHLLRDVEKQICGEGYRGIQLEKPNQIVPFFTNLFINNKSIFVHIDKKNKNAFQMFGNNFQANVKMERPGVYVIDKFYQKYNKEYSFSLTQIYGDIKFVLWNEAIGIEGNLNQSLQEVKTNDVFKAWQEYMNFEKTIYENDLTDFGFLKYQNIEVKTDQLVFNLEDEVAEEKVKNIDFEFISSKKFEDESQIPKTIEEIKTLKEGGKNHPVYIGVCKNEGVYGKKLVFDIPNYGYSDDLKFSPGLLYVSDHSIRIEQRRRVQVVKKIDSKTNESSNIIMKLSSANVVDDQLGTSFNPVNHEVLKKMFGDPNVTLKETYREAMSIALNTPDLALIQGPPGTGKTTLIKGLITRLNKMNKNFRILVSSEQHETLLNVVHKLSQNKFIPPFVSSKKIDSDSEVDDERFEKNVREFQQNFTVLCNEILRDTKKRDSQATRVVQVVCMLQDIRDNNYSKNYISTIIDDLKNKVIELGYYNELMNEISSLCEDLKLPTRFIDIEELDFFTKAIVRKIESQRIDKKVYIEDDGIRQLKDLQNLLSKNEYQNFMLEQSISESMTSSDVNKIDACFTKYIEYVSLLKDKFIPREKNKFEKTREETSEIIERMSAKISQLSKSIPKDFYEIIETLIYRLNDIDTSADIIKNYTSVIGSTCAQAGKSGELIDLKNDKFDYVIIDEAARANPLDIMIPMMMGTKVILIGDHKQLPHYIESVYVNKFKIEKDKYSNYDENLLTKSLFQIIYENLDKAYKEQRVKFKRTIQIDEQYRMHPTIGTFISNEFYGGSIRNGEKTINNINDYKMFDKKNVVWINVPILEGQENKVNQSIERLAEADKIIQLIKEMISKNEGRKLEIGIISFYKGQVLLLNKKLEECFPRSILESISCNTVDSYQGKEFDIVMVSGVRSNASNSPEKSLGFIHHSASRINVALSRAKKVLIMIADEDTYRKTEHFRKFITYVKKEGYFEQ